MLKNDQDIDIYSTRLKFVACEFCQIYGYSSSSVTVIIFVIKDDKISKVSASEDKKSVEILVDKLIKAQGKVLNIIYRYLYLLIFL